jgi:RNA polymerase sigma-70 factor (ECF subfamily)
MNEPDWLAERFEEQRGHLRAVAYRMLGSFAEADDAVQDTWLRLSRSGASDVENLGGWLTTVVARVCLNVLRSRNARREETLDGDLPDPMISQEEGTDPEREALLADAIAPALLVVLDALTPSERVAFVLHDVFGVPFDEIAPIVGRSADAARQLASRARRRVRGADAPATGDMRAQREVVVAFLAASRGGDFTALLTLLDPEVVTRADRDAIALGAAAEVRGAAAVAEQFIRRSRAAQPVLVNGAAAIMWPPGGPPRFVVGFTVAGGKIVEIELIANPVRLSQMDVAMLGT